MNPRIRYWLLLALTVSLAPHLTRLPGWLSAVLALSLLWRLPMVEGRIPLPGKWVLAPILLAGTAGIGATFHTWFGPEAGVAFLIFCLAMKLLEYRNDRDYYILMVLSLFVLATAFLFEQGLFASAYCLLAMLVVTMALVVNNLRDIPAQVGLRKAMVMLGQAVPLMLILFMFFPRLPPLWTMKLSAGSGKIGMSDSMSPGDMVSLGRSTELAFRVEFPDHNPPPKNEMYWRGLTFSHFDGKTWRPSTDARMANGGTVAWSQVEFPYWVQESIKIRSLNPLHYRVIMEASDKPWLYSLVVSTGRVQDIGLTRDFMLLSRDPVFQRLTYEADRYDVVALDPVLPEWLLRENLQLPALGNPTARQMAKQWRQHYGSEREYINAILRWYRNSPFTYTLDPPPLGNNRIDDFLFRTKRGFCEHYASSFTFLLRAGGVPARVVAGYQGGEPSPTGDSWEIRQMDAHAWVEAWLPDRGWVQFDPTSAVAPTRIEQGMNAVADNQAMWGNSAMSAVRFNNYRLLGKLRNMVDYLNYRWQRDVVGYDTHSQEEFLYHLLGNSSMWRQLGVMFGALVAVALLLAAWTIVRHRRPVDPADALVLKLSARWARRGLQRHPGEGVLAWMARVGVAQPQWEAHAKAFAAEYERLRYAPRNAGDAVSVRQLAQLMRTWPAYRPQKTQLVEVSVAEGKDSP
ncbi:transglutaminase superfamily protein [Fluviicoccus keumensis]|uniref:Transglutaminase superfamily protein n=1 Tax=Fluviicoccus keumensis TaxID=1435465 RepID=A0A4Q7ZC39_9GAMM|nr:DUF3488 and transglutaminase-like domain-containing protein [Fluviicoccus keumensis]RZU48190.1 transglutaminase superfamily protein [Fluviicoccus keumensis]